MNKKSFLDKIKNIFHSFWRTFIWWKIKIWQKIVDTSFKESETVEGLSKTEFKELFVHGY